MSQIPPTTKPKQIHASKIKVNSKATIKKTKKSVEVDLEIKV